MFLYRSLSFLTIYVWRSILKYNTTFLYWCKNIDSYYRDEILNPPDPTRGDFKPARPDPWRFQTRPTRPDILKTSSIAIYRFVLGPVRRVAIALISHEIQKASFFVLNSIKKCPPLSSGRMLFQRKRISPFSRALLMVSLGIPMISEAN